MGGSDQLFNNLVGRDLQADAGKSGQAVIVTPLLVGTDGVKKMSKALKNYIGVADPASGPSGMFGKIMSLPDALMESYYTLLTDLPMGPVKEQIQRSPRDAKIALAKHVITWLHNAEAANSAEADFVAQFVKHEAPQEMPEFGVGDLGPGPHKLPVLLVRAGLAVSNGEGTRKIKEGAVSVDGEKVTDFQKCLTIDKATVLKLGRKYARILP
jgi:tyrosyl-tRNA synthetase